MDREKIKAWITWFAVAANWLLDAWNTFPSFPTWKEESEQDYEKESG